jgi:hypothetical protein
MSKTAHFPQICFYLNCVTANVDCFGIYLALNKGGERMSRDIRMRVLAKPEFRNRTREVAAAIISNTRTIPDYSATHD